MSKRKIYKKKRYVIPLTILTIVIVARLLLPTLVKNYVNNVLAEIPGYYGHVKDIDISLIRGAYVINGLFLNKKEAKSQVPFIAVDKTDISIQWRALLNGEIVSELYLTKPSIIYVFEDHKTTDSTDIEDWSKALTDIVPIDINHLTITNGKAAFVEINTSPSIDLHLRDINLQANNLRNVVQKKRNLPSTINATAVSIGNGKLKLDGKMDLVKQIPNIDVSLALENANATALNNFTNHYSGIDFKEGNFNLYSEIAIADGFLTGYFKPILKDAKLISKEDGFFETLWEGFVGFFKFILKNQKQNTLATKVPVEGDLTNVKTKILPTVTNIFKNAWISAFKGKVDDNVAFKDAEKGADKSNEKKKKK